MVEVSSKIENSFSVMYTNISKDVVRVRNSVTAHKLELKKKKCEVAIVICDGNSI